MRPQHKRKLIAGLVSAAGAAVLAMGSLTAGAFAAPNLSNPYGAQSTNVPYVAWVGEHVRLVACNAELTEDLKAAAVKKNVQPKFILGSFANVNFAVEDWSGYQFQPPTPDGDAGSQIGQQFDPGPAAFFESSEGRDCIATDYKSLNPGLTRIRAVVKNDETGEVIFSHQFLVIWLTADKPILSETGETAKGTETFQPQLNSSGQANLSSFLGDKAGDGKFIPSPFSDPTGPTDKGLVQIKVTGKFPVVFDPSNENLSSPLHNILSKTSYTLPADWATLAETLSSSQEETEPPGTNPKLWDIHGTPSNNTVSNTSSTSALFATFSREGNGGFTSGATATVGPYDPQAAYETLVSDNELNADDAPMPAMRVDVSIAANTGGEDLGGVGQISGASKAMIYSHDFTGSSEEAGNLYNPYYGAYIPATDRGTPQSSGVTGPSPGGDFPGFLRKPGNAHPDPYTFWTSVLSSNERTSQSTTCLRREGGQPEDYVTPGGPRTETFYTDERGEAYVTYTPGNSFYLENLPVLKKGEKEEHQVIKNMDGGCDLKLLKGQEIGKSVISAKAVYPYEPVDYSAQNSEGSLTKTITSEWEKEWFQFSKGNGSNENTVKIIVAKAKDIDGFPFVGEAVCFVAPNGGTVSHFPGNSVYDEKGLLGFGEKTNVVVGPSTIVHPEGKEGKLCETTNSNGLAAIEVTNSTLKMVDLSVEYVEENILRDHEVSFVTEAEEKAAEEKAAEAKEAAEDVTAEKKINEEASANQKAREAEEAANNKIREEAAAAEKTKLAEEVTKKTKTEAEAKTQEEATKKKNEEAAATEKAANEVKKTAEEKTNKEAIEKLARIPGGTSGAGALGGSTSLVTQIPNPTTVSATGSGGVKGSKGHKAHASKHKKHKKAKKSKKK